MAIANKKVLQAVLITLGVFIGLTLFTLQTRLDFSSLYPFLFAGIWGILAASLVQLFLPFNATADLLIAGFSVVLFSAFVLYDTQQIMKRLSVDEVILGECSSLWLWVSYSAVCRIRGNGIKGK